MLWCSIFRRGGTLGVDAGCGSGAALSPVEHVKTRASYLDRTYPDNTRRITPDPNYFRAPTVALALDTG